MCGHFCGRMSHVMQEERGMEATGDDAPLVDVQDRDGEQEPPSAAKLMQQGFEGAAADHATAADFDGRGAACSGEGVKLGQDASIEMPARDAAEVAACVVDRDER